MRAGELIAARKDEIARLITLESGLCLKDSTYEVGRASDVLLFAANQALVDDGQVFSCDLTHHGKSRKVYTLREPLLGAISAITPFNHPLNQVIHKVAPSVATNNRMVLKPTEKTPLAALLLADILYEAGLPPQMLSVVTGDPREIADEMITNADADLVTFTGGVPVGKSIASKAVYKRMVLELGGNDPLVVMEDADPRRRRRSPRPARTRTPASAAPRSSACSSTRRLPTLSSSAWSKKTKTGRYGDPLDPNVDMGTVIDEEAAKLFERGSTTPARAGAKLLVGNQRRGALYSPTVLDRSKPEMEVVREETFGPVSPVIRFRDADEAIRLVNGTAYGLSSGVCTNRIDYVTKFVAAFNVGSVNVWEVPGYRLEHALRRHQGLGARLQGRRGRGDEELHQREDLFDPLVMPAKDPRLRRRRQPLGEKEGLAGRQRRRRRARPAGRGCALLPAPVALHALPDRDQVGLGHLARDRGRRAHHGLPRQQRAPARPRASARGRGGEARARHAAVLAAALHQRLCRPSWRRSSRF